MIGAAIVFAAIAGLFAYRSYTAPATQGAVARLIDRRLELKDRLATALEFQGDGSPIAAWLMEDAEQHARFVKARNVVPLPPRPSPRGKLLLLLLAASTAVWFVPLPQGVFTAEEALAPPGEVAALTEDEIFERASRLFDEVRTVQSPQLQRIQRDIAQLQAGLRDRSLPRNEALALLELLERRARSALEALQVGMSASDPADLDRLQDLASRLVAAATQARGGSAQTAREAIQQFRQLNADALEQNPELERLLDRLSSGDPLEISDELVNAANSLREAADRSMRSQSDRAELEGETDNSDMGSGGGDPRPGEDESPAGESSQGAFALEEDESAAGEASDSLSAGEAADGADQAAGVPEGSGSKGGTEAGGDPGGEFMSSEALRELHYLSSEILDGPIRTGSVQANVNIAGQGGEAFRVTTFAEAPSIDAEAIDREQIPLAYRETVRRYFQSLEPSSE